MALLTALPWPVRLIFFALTGVLATKLLQGFGWVFGVAAAMLWAVAILAMLQAAGMANGLNRMPGVAPLMARIGGGAATSRSPAAPAGAPGAVLGAAPEQPQGQYRKQLLDEADAELRQMRGIADVQQAIGRLVEMTDDARRRGRAGFGINAPAMVLVLTGGPGTGKTTVARLLARLFYGHQALERPDVRTLTAQELIGGYGAQAGQAAQRAAEEARGGLLLLDGADWLTQSQPLGGSPGLDTGQAILRVAETQPGRLLIAMTMSEDSFHKLINDTGHHTGWLGKLRVERIPFPPHLPEDDLMALLEAQLASHGLPVESGARPALRGEIRDMQRRPAPVFDNAIAMRRLAERVQDKIQARLRDPAGGSGHAAVTITDVRALQE
jgi:hypothetical protein